MASNKTVNQQTEDPDMQGADFVLGWKSSTSKTKKILPHNVALSYNPYKFSVHLAANQTGLVDATFTKVLFDTERFDTNGDFASNRYVAPVDGFYQINAYLSVLFSGGAVGVAGILSLYKNGVELLRHDMGTPSAGNNASLLTGNFSGLIELDAGDYLEIFAYADVTGGTGTVSGGAVSSRFSGFLVSKT